MSKALLGILTGIFLILASLMVSVPLNKYGGVNPTIIDCDTNADAVLTWAAWIAWVASVGLATWWLSAKKTFGANLESLTLVIALGISVGAAFKYDEIRTYRELTVHQCAALQGS